MHARALKAHILDMERNGAPRQLALRRAFNRQLRQLRGGGNRSKVEVEQLDEKMKALHKEPRACVWRKNASYGPHAQAIFWDKDQYACLAVRKKTLKPQWEEKKKQKNAGMVAALLRKKGGLEDRTFWVCCTHLSSGSDPGTQQERADEINVLLGFIQGLRSHKHEGQAYTDVVLGMDSNCEIADPQGSTGVSVQRTILAQLGMQDYTQNLELPRDKKFLSVVKMRGLGTSQPYKTGGLELHTIDCLASTMHSTVDMLERDLIVKYTFSKSDIETAKQIMDPDVKQEDVKQEGACSCAWFTCFTSSTDTSIRNITSRMLPNAATDIQSMSDHLPIAVQFGDDVRVCQWNLLAEQLSNDGFLPPTTTRDNIKKKIQEFQTMKDLRRLSDVFWKIKWDMESPAEKQMKDFIKTFMQRIADDLKAGKQNGFSVEEFLSSSDKQQYLTQKGIMDSDDEQRKFIGMDQWTMPTKDPYVPAEAGTQPEKWTEDTLRTKIQDWERVYRNKMTKQPFFDEGTWQKVMTAKLDKLKAQNVGIFTFQEMDGGRYQTFRDWDLGHKFTCEGPAAPG